MAAVTLEKLLFYSANWPPLSNDQGSCPVKLKLCWYS
jgi:hypothetical protein